MFGEICSTFVLKMLPTIFREMGFREVRALEKNNPKALEKNNPKALEKNNPKALEKLGL